MNYQFKELSIIAMEDYFLKKHVRDSTRIFYYAIQGKLFAELGDYDITDITPQTLQDFFDHEAEKGKPISRRTVGAWTKILNETFDYAIQHGIIEKTPMLNTIILPPAADFPEPDDRFLNENQIETLFLALSDNILYATIAETLLLSGLRIGELLALSQKDLIPEKNMIRVRHSLTRAIVDEKTVRVRYVVGEPKTRGSKRDVFVSPLFFVIIKNWTANIKTDGRMKKAAEKGNQDYIFINKNGDLFNYHTLEQNFRKYLTRHDISFKVTFHMLRHCYVSYMVGSQNGVTLEDISRQIGHKSIKTTYDVYYTQTNEMQRKLSVAGTSTFKKFTTLKK